MVLACSKGKRKQMIESNYCLSWLEEDDRTVVEEMRRDVRSRYWFECRECVKRMVQIQAKNIPNSYWEDIVQDAMMRVQRSLPAFQYHSTLQTWLYVVVRNCIIDMHRKLTRSGQFMVLFDDIQDDTALEGEVPTTVVTRSVEDECITHEELDQALAALREYVSLHARPIRNGRILDMVLFEGDSLEQAARTVGCSVPVAGYVVREAQRFVSKKLRQQR